MTREREGKNNNQGLYNLKDWEELNVDDKKEIVENEKQRYRDHGRQLSEHMEGWDSCNV